MLEYVSHYFNIKNNVVEKDFIVNPNMFTYDILYDYSPVLELPDSIEEFKSSHHVTMHNIDSHLHCWRYKYQLQRDGMRFDRIYDEILHCLT